MHRNKPNITYLLTYWTNADPIHWRIYAALVGDELNMDTVTFQECSVTNGARRVPSAEEKAAFRKSLDNSAHMMFHQATGLPLQSSPVSEQSRNTEHWKSHVTWQPLLGLLCFCPVMWSSVVKSLQLIWRSGSHKCQIFKQIAMT